MDNLKPWTLIKYGFWLGIGFVLPSVVVTIFGSLGALFVMPAAMDAAEEELMEDVEFPLDLDKSGLLEITGYREVRTDGQMYIIGAVRNNGEEPLSSVQLEAEMYDADAEFVYECSEYISRSIQPGASENFRMVCGCKDQQLPEYSEIRMSVTNAYSL